MNAVQWCILAEHMPVSSCDGERPFLYVGHAITTMNVSQGFGSRGGIPLLCLHAGHVREPS